MIKRSISILSLMLVFATSCEQNYNYNKAEQEEMVTRTIKTDDGRVLNLDFDNAKDIVVVNFDGTQEVLKRKKSASGYWYANDHYELQGKGDNIYLIKDGKRIFEHQDDVQYIESENNKGDKLNMTFNNTTGTVKVYLNDEEEIELKEKKAASGIWYGNDEYELSGKGDYYQLKRGDEIIYEN